MHTQSTNEQTTTVGADVILDMPHAPPHPPLQKYLILIASLIIQICLGGMYAWSTFVPDLRESAHLTTAQTQLIFGIQIAVFTVAMVFFGRLLARVGPRVLVLIAGTLFFLGYAIASLSGGAYPLLLLGIGIFVGIATGCGYVCPLTTCMKWFPTHKGLITGITVAGFGGGAILLANIAEYLLEHNRSALDIFLYIAIIYGIAIFCAGIFMSLPAPVHSTDDHIHPPLKILLNNPFFWVLTIGMLCGTFAGLMVIGNLVPLAIDEGIQPITAALAVSAFAVGNATGRITWGKLVDVWHNKTIVPSLTILAIALALLIPSAITPPTFILLSALVGFGFGACFVIYAVLVAAHYGAHTVGHIYPLIFLAYGIAALTGPYIGGKLFDITTKYTAPITVSVAVVLVGIIATIILLKKDRPVKILPEQ